MANLNPVYLQALQDILQSSPPAFVAHPEHSKSRGTRDFNHFDLHLSPDLVAQEIILVPNMTKELAAVTQKHVRELQTLSDPTLLLQKWQKNRRALPRWTVMNEGGIEWAYINLIAPLVTSLASTLLTRGHSSVALVQVGKKNIHGDTPFAIADAYMSVIDSATMGLPGDASRLFEAVLNWKLGNLIAFEFKSLTAGDKKTMQAIVDNCGNFVWTSCPKATNCGSGLCRERTDLTSFTITGHRAGYDSSFIHDETRMPSANQPPAAGSHITLKPTAEVEDNSTQDDEDEEEPDVDEAEYSSRPRAKAPKICQQTWAEVVNIDSTFGVVHSGSYELIVIRDRDNQRMYISEVIEVDSPGYFEIEVGLYLSAATDGLERGVALERKTEFLPRFDMPFGTAEADTKLITDPAFVTLLKAERTQIGLKREALLAAMYTIRELRITWREQVNIFGPNGKQTTVKRLTNNENWRDGTFDLTVLRLYTNASRTYECILQGDERRICIGGITLKVASNLNDIDKLIRQQKIYTELARSEVTEGVNYPYGIFSGKDHCGTPIYVQLLPYAGQRLDSLHKNRIPLTVRKVILRVITHIHDMFWTHNDLRPYCIHIHRVRGKINVFVSRWTSSKYHPQLKPSYKEERESKKGTKPKKHSKAKVMVDIRDLTKRFELRKARELQQSREFGLLPPV